jgi:hypothetical protein
MSAVVLQGKRLAKGAAGAKAVALRTGKKDFDFIDKDSQDG